MFAKGTLFPDETFLIGLNVSAYYRVLFTLPDIEVDEVRSSENTNSLPPCPPASRQPVEKRKRSKFFEKTFLIVFLSLFQFIFCRLVRPNN